jgi:hypothetical protein
MACCRDYFILSVILKTILFLLIEDNGRGLVVDYLIVIKLFFFSSAAWGEENFLFLYLLLDSLHVFGLGAWEGVILDFGVSDLWRSLMDEAIVLCDIDQGFSAIGFFRRSSLTHNGVHKIPAPIHSNALCAIVKIVILDQIVCSLLLSALSLLIPAISSSSSFIRLFPLVHCMNGSFRWLGRVPNPKLLLLQ